MRGESVHDLRIKNYYGQEKVAGAYACQEQPEHITKVLFFSQSDHIQSAGVSNPKQTMAIGQPCREREK